MTESANSLEILHRFWAYVDAHSAEIVWAVIVGVILDLLTPQGRVRTGIRHIENKWSERSARGLQKRIKQLEINRDQVSAYLASDKTLYLATFRFVIVTLVFIAMGAGIRALIDILPSPPGRPPMELLAVLSYFLAIVVGIQGLRISALDTREKISELLAKLQSEVEDLKKKAGHSQG